MKYPIVLTVIGSHLAYTADSEMQRDDKIAMLCSEGYSPEDIVCFELGLKWNFAGYMFSNVPFPAANK